MVVGGDGSQGLSQTNGSLTLLYSSDAILLHPRGAFFLVRESLPLPPLRLSFVHHMIKIDGLVFSVIGSCEKHWHPMVFISSMCIVKAYDLCSAIEDLEKLTPTVQHLSDGTWV